MASTEYAFELNEKKYTGRLDYKTWMAIERLTGKSIQAMVANGAAGMGLTEQSAIIQQAILNAQPESRAAKISLDLEAAVNENGLDALSDIAMELLQHSGLLGKKKEAKKDAPEGN